MVRVLYRTLAKTEFRPERAFRVLVQIWESPLQEVPEFTILGQPDGSFHLQVLKRFEYIGFTPTFGSWGRFVRMLPAGRKALERIANAGVINHNEFPVEQFPKPPHFNPRWTEWYG